MGLGKSKQSTGRSGYPGNFSSSPHYGASHYAQKQGYGSHNGNHRAATAGQLGKKTQLQHQHLKQRQQNHQNQLHQQQAQRMQHTHQSQHQHVLKQRNKTTEECYVCGHEGHSGLRCFHRKMACHICNKTGHLASVCKQKQHHAESIYKPKPKPKPNQPNKTTQRTTRPKAKA